MVRVLIADDEYLVLDFIKFIIENNLPSFEVVGTAQSGREAIEKAITLNPDVILMDIRIPGINGIEAIKQIKERGVRSEVVIISAYEYFDYAKEAVKLNVFEYLLKPLNKKKVVDTLLALEGKINNDRETIQKQIFMREKMERLLPHMEGQFVHTQLFSDGDISNLGFYEELFHMKLDQGYVIVGTLSGGNDMTEEGIRDTLERQKFFDIFGITLKQMTTCLVGPPMLDRIIAYVAVEDGLDALEARKQAIDIGTRLAQKLKKSVLADFRIGVGSLHGIGNFSKSCSEAYSAAAIASNGHMIHFEDLALKKMQSERFPKSKEQLMLQKAIAGDVNGTVRHLEDIMVWMAVNYKDDVDKIKASMVELYIQVKRHLPEGEWFDYDFISSLLKINDKSELEYIFVSKIRSLIEQINQERDQEMNSLIAKAVDFIKENYNQNITLDDVAKEINMSYHYFSKLFKTSTGKKFSDFIMDLRIEEAKRLLLNPEKSIKDICYEIGYNDPNYFSKIFRKVTGKAPTEFRQKM
ncbi:MAG: response regulator [Clostridia bacterium]|nr:response regulator [Clostridia bacterium]